MTLSFDFNHINPQPSTLNLPDCFALLNERDGPDRSRLAHKISGASLTSIPTASIRRAAEREAAKSYTDLNAGLQPPSRARGKPATSPGA